MTENCIFCKIISKEIPSNIVFEDDSVMAFLDINPISEGHTLVLPKNHSIDFLELDKNVLSDLTIKTQFIAEKIKKVLKADGINISFNIGRAAGQIIFHTHVHVIPRYENDGLKGWSRHSELTSIDFKEMAEKIKKEFQ